MSRVRALGGCQAGGTDEVQVSNSWVLMLQV